MAFNMIPTPAEPHMWIVALWNPERDEVVHPMSTPQCSYTSLLICKAACAIKQNELSSHHYLPLRKWRALPMPILLPIGFKPVDIAEFNPSVHL